jgi:type IV pilus assembly protein PilE
MKSQRGFTLLELMVVVAIIAILALIAFPSYTEYVRKGKRSSGIGAINQLQLALERYRSDCPTYASSTSSPDCLDYNHDGDHTDSGETYPSVTSTYYTIAVSGQSATGYTVTATPLSTFSDPKCGTLTVVYSGGAVTSQTVSGTQTAKYCFSK